MTLTESAPREQAKPIYFHTEYAGVVLLVVPPVSVHVERLKVDKSFDNKFV